MATTNLDSADLKAVAYKGLINEDVMQKIWDISKIPLPFTDLIGTDTCKNSYTEWTEDTLAAPNLTNAVVDGADASGNDTRTGARVGTHCQISMKVVRVSTRARESDTIGRSDELSFQIMRRQQELRRDVEAISLSNQASVADDGATTAGKTAGLGAWLVTNDFRGAGGSAAGFANGVVAAPVAGTARALTETLIRDAVQSVYQQGGDPTKLMSVPSVIRKFSEYLFTSSARVATLMSDQGTSSSPATALGTVNIFVTDFGTLDLIPNRLQQLNTTPTPDTADVYILDPKYISHAFMYGYRTEDLAKTGLSDVKQISVDWALKVMCEKANAVIADCDPTLAVTL